MSLPATPEPTHANSRERRNRVLKGGAILTGINNSAINCTIRNMHAHGAELRVPLESRVPTDFMLYVPVDGIVYIAQIRWRKLDRCGVVFTGIGTKPSWYYG